MAAEGPRFLAAPCAIVDRFLEPTKSWASERATFVPAPPSIAASLSSSQVLARGANRLTARLPRALANGALGVVVASATNPPGYGSAIANPGRRRIPSTVESHLDHGAPAEIEISSDDVPRDEGHRRPGWVVSRRMFIEMVVIKIRGVLACGGDHPLHALRGNIAIGGSDDLEIVRGPSERRSAARVPRTIRGRVAPWIVE